MSHAIVLVAVDGKKSDIEAALKHQMAPFDENNQMFRDGSRWDWYQIGGRFKGWLHGQDILQRKDVSLVKMKAENEEAARQRWADAMKEKHDPAMLSLIYGINEKTVEEHVAASSNVSFPAFLRNRHWHENERMGWWGGTAKTECEIEHGDDYKGKCLHTDEKTGARIICWNDPKWDEKYWPRFIEHLDPETWLVVVDYHV